MSFSTFFYLTAMCFKPYCKINEDLAGYNELFTPQGDYEAWVFAAYTVDGYSYDYPTGFADAEEFAAFVRVAVEATPYETGVSVTSGDRILLLSTCAYSYEGARFVVLGKLVEVL